jgi:hypothetical protein
MDVAEWLRRFGLEQYAPAFRAHDIDAEVLRRLTGEDLRELGVTSIGHRRRLLDAIAALGTAEPLPTPPAPTLTLPRLRGREQRTTLRCKRGREGWGPRRSAGN